MSCPRYQAPGKSKSPVKFGDEDWELAWEDDPSKAPQIAKNGQMDKRRKSEKKGIEDGDINGESMITQDASGNNDGPSGPLDRDSTCESNKGHLEGAALRNENKGSQRTDTQRSKTTQRRPKNYKEHKPKASPHKKQKSEDV